MGRTYTKIELLPDADTLCNLGFTNIAITSISIPTRPIRFYYTARPDYPDSVVVTYTADTTDLANGFVIADQIENLSDTAQLVRFIVTPYTTGNNGAIQCVNGDNDTAYIWVEPSPKVLLQPQADTLCNPGETFIRLTTPTQSMYPVLFRYQVIEENPDSVNVVINGAIAGLPEGYVISDSSSIFPIQLSWFILLLHLTFSMHWAMSIVVV